MSKGKKQTKSTIRRMKHERNFLVVGNKLCQRGDITYAGLGLLVHLLSRPDDWEVVMSQLERAGSRRDKIGSLIKELRSLGYIDRVELRDADNGQFGGYQYLVSESPETYIPETGSPETGSPETVDPQLQRTDSPAVKTHSVKSLKHTQDNGVCVKVFGDFLKKMELLYGEQRVADVCAYAVSKDDPPAWASKALSQGWAMTGKIVAPVKMVGKYKKDSALFFYHQHLVEHGMTKEQADEYVVYYPNTWLYTGRDGKRYSQDDDFPEVSVMLGWLADKKEREANG